MENQIKLQKIKRIRIRFSCHHAFELTNNEFSRKVKVNKEPIRTMNNKGYYHYKTVGWCDKCNLKRGIAKTEELEMMVLIT